MQSPIAYSALVDRPPLRWPDNARVALWVQVNLEHFEFDGPGTVLPPVRPTPMVPDVNNAGWRDYGPRVGIWRLMEMLDRHSLRSSTPTNADVYLHYPELIREAQRRNWEFMGHGITNSQTLNGLPEDEERAVIRKSVQALVSATGRAPRGWLGPGLAETFRTLDLLAEAGFEYVSDWCNDDQPYPIEVASGRLIGVPYCKDIGDLPAFLGAGLSPERYCQMLCDQFDVLFEEGARSGRIFGVALHPFVAGQAFRAKWVDKAFEYILGHNQVWATTAGDIADWYYEHYYEEALGQLRRRAGRGAATGER
jgi:peptidoglycan/xylan/chitin deacetylase (PgdA/CDA1 family)